ncbi:MAG: YeeE/YedE family protein [Acidimicrobiia bacterium]|nr:YeeE/YedE family protein [Acidimicrobiia bacterium]
MSNLRLNISSLFVGLYFGIVLVKSEVVSWFRIQAMFRFEEPHMYLIIGSAVVVGAISYALVRRFELKSPDGEVVDLPEKVYTKGTVIGGVTFGMGWAVTGACPGPIYAQIGSGALFALVTFAGAMIGVYFYGLLRPRLPV